MHVPRRHRALALATTAVVAVTLSACSTGGSLSDGGGDTSSGPEVWNEATADLSGVTITFGGGTAGGPLDGATAAFEDQTGATIERVTYPDPYEQSLQTAVATGDVPDLASWQPTTSMLTVLQAPTKLLTLDEAPWLDELDPAVRDLAGFVDGTRYAALISSPSVMGVYYNKAVFEQYGLTEPPTDWAQLVAYAETVRDGGGVAFAEAGGAQWPTQWWVQTQLAEAAQDGLWDEVNSNATAFTDEPILGAVEEYRRLVDAGLFNSDLTTMTFEEQGTALMTGETAMVMQVTALLELLLTQYSAEEIDDTIGWFPISAEGTVATSIPDNKNGIIAFATGDAEREAASRQFLRFLMTDYYEEFIADGGLVSLKTDVPDPENVTQVAVDIDASLESSVGSMQSLAVANPDLYINLASMLYGEMTPEQVAQATQDQFEQLASAQGIEGF